VARTQCADRGGDAGGREVMELRAKFAAGAAALAAVFSTGCGGDPAATGRVSFQVFGDAEELRIYRNLVTAYEKTTGGSVSLVETPDRKGHLARLATGFAAGRPPDVFLINQRNVGGFVARGGVDPVAARLAASDVIDQDDLYPVALDAFRDGAGVVQCVPQNVSSLVVYYNADAFGRAGLAKPAPNWNYDDLLRTARALTRDDDGDGTPEQFGIATEPSTIRAAPFVWAAGGELVDDARAPTRTTLDTPAARSGLQRLVALRAEGLAPDAKAVAARAVDERFLDGSVAMLLGSRREVPTLRTIKDFAWDVAPLPALGPRGDRASVLHADGFCLARGGQADAAWRFAEFAAGPQGQRILALGGRTVPSLRSVARSRAFLNPGAAPRSSRVFLDQTGRLGTMPNSKRWTDTEDKIDLAIEQAYYGRIDVAEAARRIARETQDGL